MKVGELKRLKALQKDQRPTQEAGGHPYLFVLDGAKALIQCCRVHKKLNIQKYLPKKYHGLLSIKLKVAWEMTDYA